jgi:hypothetical protein
VKRLRNALLCVAFATSFAPRDAGARKVERVPYAMGDVWNTAVRFVVVDESYAVVERDSEAGYIVFKFVPPGSKREERGSLELVRQGDETDVIGAMPSMPAHHEAAMIERLVAKLRRELLARRPAPRDGSNTKKPAPKADAGLE